ncbi:hypothetical protein KIN20_002816 [Parelaphostrongylus tenuis]|uniref:Uncharacterized protein n=1 Tax=Parelaphostrongylus tenuis TaxID=148309 RepID=A0AAD5MHC5_PARTN|nr:hypothetical protein KIN20_002816 [Parelaphostrongylus tenuis]
MVEETILQNRCQEESIAEAAGGGAMRCWDSPDRGGVGVVFADESVSSQYSFLPCIPPHMLDFKRVTLKS